MSVSEALDLKVKQKFGLFVVLCSFVEDEEDDIIGHNYHAFLWENIG